MKCLLGRSVSLCDNTHEMKNRFTSLIIASLLGLGAAATSSQADHLSDLNDIASQSATGSNGPLVNEGEVSPVSAYDVSHFSLGLEQQKLLMDFISSGKGCPDTGLLPNNSIQKNIDAIIALNSDSAQGNDELTTAANKVASDFSDLQKNSGIKSLISVGWQPDSSETKEQQNEEALRCAMYLYRIFTNDGHTLTLYYNMTD